MSVPDKHRTDFKNNIDFSVDRDERDIAYLMRRLDVLEAMVKRLVSEDIKRLERLEGRLREMTT